MRIVSKSVLYRESKNVYASFFLQLHVTNRCNLRCKHCYEAGYTLKKQDKLLKSSEILEIIDQYRGFLDQFGYYGRIYFTGGEPIIDPNLRLYISKASQLHMCTMILSNGTLIDPTTAHLLREAGTHIVQVSLDGLEETHDAIRGRGNFAKATQGLDNCYKAGIRTTAMLTLSKLNASEIDAILQHCIHHKVRHFSLGRLVPIGNGALLSEHLLTNKELLEVFKNIKRLKKRYNDSISISIHDPLWLTYLGVKNTCGCSAGIRGICVVENGDIMPCRRLELVVGNIKTTSLLNIWNSDCLRHFRERDNYLGKCKECRSLKVCGGCRAVAKGSGGSEFGEDPQCFLKK